MLKLVHIEKEKCKESQVLAAYKPKSVTTDGTQVRNGRSQHLKPSRENADGKWKRRQGASC